MSLTRIHNPLSQTLVRRIGDAGGPRADQVGEELDNIISEVNAATVAFSVQFPIADPTAQAVGTILNGLASWVCPDGASVLLTKVKAKYDSGTHTAGGSVTFTVERRTAAASWADPTTMGSISLDDTNNAPFAVYTNDIADQTLLPGDTLICYISARSGTINERNVSVQAIGTQGLTT